jgi:hypothetical protein
MRINRESIGRYAIRCAAIAILLAFPALSQAQTRTVLVSPVAGDPVASGTALRNALTGIQSPSSTNPWLLKVEPGIYDVQGNSLQMRQWVSIEGSGIEATTIRGNVQTIITQGAPFLHPAGTVNGADNVELRNLTVENTGSGQHRIAMLNRNASPRVYRVRFVTQGDEDKSLWGMLNMGFGGSGSPILEEIEVRVTGGRFTIGIEYQGTEIFSELHRSRIVVLGGTTQSAGIAITNGRLNRIRDTIIETYFGKSASGIHIRSVFTNPPQDLWLTNTTIISFSSTDANYGINCDGAIAVNVSGSQIFVNGASQKIGIHQPQTTGPITVLNSYIQAGSGIVFSNGPVGISNSHLVGGPVTGSFKGCYGVVDEAGVFYTGPCPP